jgi:NhaA family Na+:H+ antiporter
MKPIPPFEAIPLSDKKTLHALIEHRASLILTPLEAFVRKQAASGILLIITIAVALFMANSPWAAWLPTIGGKEMGGYLGHYTFSMTILEWIGDGLLAVFFFMVGLEIKREVLIGELRHPKHALLVIIAAAGGMIVPAGLYLLLNFNGEGQSGWAIPMATDTAFAIGVLALLARHVSVSATIFLTALAIIDDIVTVLVIALFYTNDFEPMVFMKAFVPLGILVACNFLGIRRGWIYMILGIALWWYIHAAGIHGTLAGLLMAFAIPARSQIGQLRFIEKMKTLIFDFEKGKRSGETILQSDQQHQLADNMGNAIRAASTPLQRWHSGLEIPVAILVLPLFALFNAGVHLSADSVSNALSSPVSWGIMLGLVVGKPLGITCFSYIAIRWHIGKMPHGMVLTELIGAALLAGIGFTMSLFIALLGFEQHPEFIEPAKIGILLSSLIAAFLGMIWLRMTAYSNKASA